MFVKALVSFIQKFFFLINILFAMYSLLVYQFVFTATIKHWIAGFLMLSFPIVLVGNLIFFMIWAIALSPKALLSLLMLLLPYSIKERTFKFRNSETFGSSDFSLLSYNLMYVDYPSYKNGLASEDNIGASETIVNLEADIKCFQEFYNNEKIHEFNLIKRVSDQNRYYVYMHSEKGNDRGRGAIGLATFSKYPIINKEEIYWNTNNNGLLATDIVINKDTIRVINFQLKSMGIRVANIIDNDKKISKEETRNVLSKLKQGFIVRGHEVDILESWIDKSPYPVLIAGDLNELPYGYAYGKIRKKLNNSFEDMGLGFGFTYRKILTFLRIDNQFYDGSFFRVTKFDTRRDVKYSDHYPLYAEYEIKK